MLTAVGDIRATSKDDMAAALGEAGLRVTRQRQAIIDCLAGRNDHPSARRIYRDLERADTRLSLATVYNTLATLVELGVLAEMEFEGSDNRYDTNLTPHLNLVCTGCGAIADLVSELPAEPSAVRGEVGFETTGYRLEYRGICARCRARTANDRSRRPS